MNGPGYKGESAMERAEVLRDFEPRHLSRAEQIERDPDSFVDDERQREIDGEDE